MLHISIASYYLCGSPRSVCANTLEVFLAGRMLPKALELGPRLSIRRSCVRQHIARSAFLQSLEGIRHVDMRP